MSSAKSIAKNIKQIEETDKSSRPLVSVVTPVYNEAPILEKNLSTLCQYIESLEDQYRWELIVVNDGSTDETAELADSFAKTRDNVRVLHHMYNFRLGQALRYAFSKCRGDYVVVMDADLSYAASHIEKMLTAIVESRAKIVVASPYMKGGTVSNVPLPRKFMSICANRFIAFFAKDRYCDRLSTLTGMVRTYDRRFLSRLNLKAMDMDINTEILYKAMILRARIVEIPAHLNWNSEETATKYRKSSMRIFRSIILSFLSGFMFRPFMFFILPGLVVIMLALYPIGWTVIHTLAHLQGLSEQGSSFAYRFSIAIAAAFSQSPHSFIVGGFALMVGIQLICLGIIALQNKRYFEELFHIGSNIYALSHDNEIKK